MTPEAPILQLANVTVTTTKVVVHGTTYFLPNITSVKMVEDDNVRNIGFVVAVVGVLLAIAGISQVNAPLIVIGLLAGGVGAFMIKTGVAWELVLTTGATEQHTLKSPDKAVVTRVLAAINVAVEQRMMMTGR